MFSHTQFVRKSEIIVSYVILARFLLFLTPFSTFLCVTYFYFLICFIFMCKIFIISINFNPDNDRSSVEMSRVYIVSFYLKSLS